MANLAGLTVFWSLFWTVSQTHEDQIARAQSEKAYFNARMVALRSEILLNIDVCDKILAGREQHLQAVTVPDNTFVLISTEESLRSGELTYNKLRNELRNTYHRMLWANRVMDNSVQLFYSQTLGAPENQQMVNTRIRNVMSALILGVEEIERRLKDLDPLFWPFMKNPHHYDDTVTFGSPENAAPNKAPEATR